MNSEGRSLVSGRLILNLALLLGGLTGGLTAETTRSSMPPSEWALSRAELMIWNSPRFKREFIESYKAETDVEPPVNSIEVEQMEKVMDLFSANKMREASEQLKKYRSETSSAVFDFTLANIYFQQGKFSEAIPVYEGAVEKYPTFRRAWKNLAICYISVEEFDDAIAALTRVIELGEHTATMYGSLGLAYLTTEKNISAESALRMAVILDPDELRWSMGLARSFFMQERYGDAVAICDQMLKDNPDNAEIWKIKGNAYLGMNQSTQAAQMFELLHHMGKSTFATQTMLGDIYVLEELYEMAVDAYILALELDPSQRPDRLIRSAKILAGRGDALDQTRRLVEQIEQVYAEQLETEAKKDVLKLRARLAVASGASDEEARVLEEIVELDPLDGEALILLGQHSIRQDDPVKAAFYYERAAMIDKFEADAKLRHAQLLVSQSKYDEALPLLRRVQAINPRDNIQKFLEQVERVAKTN